MSCSQLAKQELCSKGCQLRLPRNSAGKKKQTKRCGFSIRYLKWCSYQPYVWNLDLVALGMYQCTPQNINRL
jgi:hypothetical protein